MAHGLLYGASYSNGVLSFTDKQGRAICNADLRKYLTLTATEDNSSVALKKVGDVNNTYQYKLNNGAWTTYELTLNGVVIPLNAGDQIQWRCTNRSGNFSTTNYVQFVMTGKIAASNPVTSMVLYTLDPTSLGGYSHACLGLFYKCTSLIKAPELPATALPNSCYGQMFQGCSSLTRAPELPAQRLTYGCYGAPYADNVTHGMFEGCTNLHEVHVAARNGSYADTGARGWLSGVAQSGDIFCSPTGWPSGVNGIPDGWSKWVYGGTYVEDITLYLNGEARTGQLGTSPFGTCCSDNWIGYKALFEIHDMGYSLSAQETVTLYLFGDVPVTAYKVPYVADNPDGFTYDMYWASYWNGSIVDGTGTIGYKWMSESELETQDLYLSPTLNARKPLTLTATEDNSSVALKRVGEVDRTYAYRLNDGAWAEYELTENGVSIPLDAGDRVQFYCTNNNASFTSSKHLQFVMTGKIEASGILASLLRRKLNTTTLHAYCYHSLFQDCISLTQAPELPAKVLYPNCYYGMFQGCQSLVQAPELPATTLSTYCYGSMFQGCVSLAQAPALSATTLKSNCYRDMFSGCTALVKAPELPATTLATQCYAGMFQGCENLSEIRTYATNPTTGTTGNVYQWLSGASLTGDFYCDPNVTWPTGTSGIPSGWTRLPLNDYPPT